MNEIDICNKAILRVGGNMLDSTDGTINGITVNSLEAKLCRLNYALIRDVVTADRIWSFALTQAVLDTPLPAEPLFGYSFQFDLPADSVNVWRVWYPAQNNAAPNLQMFGQAQSATPWIIQGNVILANAEQIFVQYLRRLDQPNDISLMSAGFIDTFSLRLAVELALPIAQNNTLFSTLNAEYEFRKLNSYAVNGSQAAHEVFVARQLVNCR